MTQGEYAISLHNLWMPMVHGFIRKRGDTWSSNVDVNLGMISTTWSTFTNLADVAQFLNPPGKSSANNNSRKMYQVTNR